MAKHSTSKCRETGRAFAMAMSNLFSRMDEELSNKQDGYITEIERLTDELGSVIDTLEYLAITDEIDDFIASSYLD